MQHPIDSFEERWRLLTNFISPDDDDSQHWFKDDLYNESDRSDACDNFSGPHSTLSMFPQSVGPDQEEYSPTQRRLSEPLSPDCCTPPNTPSDIRSTEETTQFFSDDEFMSLSDVTELLSKPYLSNSTIDDGEGDDKDDDDDEASRDVQDATLSNYQQNFYEETPLLDFKPTSFEDDFSGQELCSTALPNKENFNDFVCNNCESEDIAALEEEYKLLDFSNERRMSFEQFMEILSQTDVDSPNQLAVQLECTATNEVKTEFNSDLLTRSDIHDTNNVEDMNLTNITNLKRKHEEDTDIVTDPFQYGPTFTAKRLLAMFDQENEICVENTLHIQQPLAVLEGGSNLSDQSYCVPDIDNMKTVSTISNLQPCHRSPGDEIDGARVRHRSLPDKRELRQKPVASLGQQLQTSSSDMDTAFDQNSNVFSRSFQNVPLAAGKNVPTINNQALLQALFQRALVQSNKESLSSSFFDFSTQTNNLSLDESSPPLAESSTVTQQLGNMNYECHHFSGNTTVLSDFQYGNEPVFQECYENNFFIQQQDNNNQYCQLETYNNSNQNLSASWGKTARDYCKSEQHYIAGDVSFNSSLETQTSETMTENQVHQPCNVYANSQQNVSHPFVFSNHISKDLLESPINSCKVNSVVSQERDSMVPTMHMPTACHNVSMYKTNVSAENIMKNTNMDVSKCMSRVGAPNTVYVNTSNITNIDPSNSSNTARANASNLTALIDTSHPVHADISQLVCAGTSNIEKFRTPVQQLNGSSSASHANTPHLARASSNMTRANTPNLTRAGTSTITGTSEPSSIKLTSGPSIIRNTDTSKLSRVETSNVANVNVSNKAAACTSNQTLHDASNISFGAFNSPNFFVNQNIAFKSVNADYNKNYTFDLNSDTPTLQSHENRSLYQFSQLDVGSYLKSTNNDTNKDRNKTNYKQLQMQTKTITNFQNSNFSSNKNVLNWSDISGQPINGLQGSSSLTNENSSNWSMHREQTNGNQPLTFVPTTTNKPSSSSYTGLFHLNEFDNVRDRNSLDYYVNGESDEIVTPVQVSTHKENTLPFSNYAETHKVKTFPFSSHQETHKVNTLPFSNNQETQIENIYTNTDNHGASQSFGIQSNNSSATQSVDDAYIPDLPQGSDPGLIEARKRCLETGKLTPVVKYELRCAIMSKRCKEGKPEIEVVFEPSPKTELTEEEKKKEMHRKELNRVAAANHRQKKKAQSISSEKEIEDLTNKKSELTETISELRKECDLYRKMIISKGITTPERLNNLIAAACLQGRV